MLAKAWLLKTLTSPDVQNPCPTKVVIQAAQSIGIRKSELKSARKEIGVASFMAGGIQYWYLPGEENNA